MGGNYKIGPEAIGSRSEVPRKFCMSIESYKDLIVWQKSIELVILTYRLTDKFPKSELYGITSQIRRAVVSIPSNIAEGYKRRHLGEYIQFLRISDASSAELETQFIISQKLGYCSGADFGKVMSLLTEVGKMLCSLIGKLKVK